MSVASSGDPSILVPDRIYGAHWYKVDSDELARLRKLSWYRPVLSSLFNWVAIFVIVRLFLYLPHHWYFYPVVAFLIAGRAGVFLQLAHEASHGLIADSPRFNEWWGRWFACYPIGLDLEGFKTPHMRHHACANEHCDPMTDTEKYGPDRVVRPRLWYLFLRDALGITALTQRLRYARPEINRGNDEVSGDDEYFEEVRPARPKSKVDGIRVLASLCLMQAIILVALFRLNPLHYVLLWLVPLMTAHMLLMRVRGIAEHALGHQLGIRDMDHKSLGKFHTRSFGTPARKYAFVPFVWIERLLISTLNVNYHHEHHLFPKVPYYNLKRVHQMVHAQVMERNPYVYVRGYFACLFFKPRIATPPTVLQAPALVS
jgi:fatty acid desaturase